jgi:hypothetical protein
LKEPVSYANDIQKLHPLPREFFEISNDKRAVRNAGESFFTDASQNLARTGAGLRSTT